MDAPSSVLHAGPLTLRNNFCDFAETAGDSMPRGRNSKTLPPLLSTEVNNPFPLPSSLSPPLSPFAQRSVLDGFPS